MLYSMESTRRSSAYSYIQLIQESTITVVTTETYEVAVEGSSDEWIAAGKDSLVKNEDASIYR